MYVSGGEGQRNTLSLSLLEEQKGTNAPALRRRYMREKMAREVTSTVMYARGTASDVAMAWWVVG